MAAQLEQRPRLREVHTTVQRSEQPLVPPPNATRWRLPGPLEQASSLMWRELNVRWPLVLLLGAAVGLLWITPPRSVDAIQLLVAMALLPFGLAFGVGSPARQEAFWMGLTPAPVLRELVPMALYVGLLGATAALIRADQPGVAQLGFVAGLSGLALGGYMRSWAATTSGRILGVVGMVALTGATLLPSAPLGVWPLLVALKWRLAMLMAVCLIARPLVAARRPATAAGRKRHGWIWVLAPLSTVLVGAVEAVWPTPVNGDLTLDRALVVPDGPSRLFSAHRVWRVDGDRPVRLDLQGPIQDATLHAASGSVLFELHMEQEGEPVVGLFVPGHGEVRCEVPDDAGWSWFAEDGRSLLRASEDGSLLSVSLEGCAAATTVPRGLPAELEIMGDRFVPTEDWKVVEVRGEGRVNLPFELVTP